MTEGWPDFWIKGKYIELIDTINTVNLIKTIQQIDNISNLGTLDTINTVGTIQKINPTATENAVIDRIAKIDNVTNLDTLNTLNTIGTIQKINPQNTDNVVIDRVKTINLIETINTLDTINTINTVGRINELKTSVSTTEMIRNPDFATGDFTYWQKTANTAVEYQADIGAYAAVLGPSTLATIAQYIPPVEGRQLKISFLCTSTVDNGEGLFVIEYTDGTITSATVTISTANQWEHKAYVTSSIKNVSRIYFRNNTDDAKFKVTFIRTYIKPRVAVESFIPDPYWTSFDVSASAASDTLVVSGLSGYRLAILDIEYESDADVEVGFRFGDGTTFETKKFARRVTAGVYAHNYIGAPRICDAEGYGLYCRVEGAVNIKGSIAYTYLP